MLPPDHEQSAPRPHLGTREAWIFWGLVLAVLEGMIFLPALGHEILGPSVTFAPPSKATYPYYEKAGHDWLEGRDLYQDVGETCRYSPLLHALLVPLAMLPEEAGMALWRLVNAAAFLGGMYWWCRAVLPRGLSDGLRGLVLVASFPLAIGSLHNYQSNPLMTGAMLAATAAAVQCRWNLAAAGLALACLLKLYPVALALLLILVFPRRLAWRFLAALAVGLGLPFLLQDPAYVARQYGNWLTNLQVDDRAHMALYRAYRDLWLLVRILHLPVSLAAYHGIQIAGAALAAGLVLLLKRRNGDPAWLVNAALGLSCCWIGLLGPATESSTFIVLAPTMGWALADVWHADRGRALRWLVLASFSLFVLARLVGLFHGTAHWHALGIQPWGALLLFAALTATLVHDAWTRRSPFAGAATRYLEWHGDPRDRELSEPVESEEHLACAAHPPTADFDQEDNLARSPNHSHPTHGLEAGQDGPSISPSELHRRWRESGRQS